MRTDKLREIMEGLKAMAASNEDRAFRILGARPGPGPDILIRPFDGVMSSEWNVHGLTVCGAAFVNKFWRFQPLSNQKVAEMRKQIVEWGLTFVTEVPTEPLED